MSKHVVILGGGISGLAAAWHLKQKGSADLKVTVIEKNARAGGWIQTKEIDGFLFDMGPRSCRVRGTGLDTLRLVEQLGLQDEVIPADKSARKRYLYLNKRLTSVPNCPVAILLSPFTKGVLKGLWHDWWTPVSALEDESIHAFISRRMNAEVADKLIDPLTTGIFAGDPQKLSVKSCFPILHEWEQKHGGIVRGAFAPRKKRSLVLSAFLQKTMKYPMFTFKRGMETLPKALAEKLSNNLLLSTSVVHLKPLNDGFELLLSNGTTLKADHLISALPADPLGDLLMPHLPSAALAMKGIPGASVTLVHLGYRKKVLKLKGFGYLIPSSEKEETLGVVWDSSAFPQQNLHPDQTRLSVMIGGSRMQDFGCRTEKEFKEIALRAVQRHMGIETLPDMQHVHIVRSAIPQYVVGHAAKIQQIEQELAHFSPHFSLLGNCFHGVSINDCVARAQQCVEKLSD